MSLLTSLAAVPVAVLFFSAVQSQEPKIALKEPFEQPAVVEIQKVEPIKEEIPLKTQSDSKAQVVSVAQGDSLSSIAGKYHTTWKRLYDKNEQIIYPDIIHLGDEITIPSSSEELASRSVPTQEPVIARKTERSDTNFAATIPTGSNSAWDRLAQCESSGNWSINTGNGYYGGLQFTLSSWRGVGGSGLPSEASRSEQIARAKILQTRQGWGAWPACSARLGLR